MRSDGGNIPRRRDYGNKSLRLDSLAFVALAAVVCWVTAGAARPQAASAYADVATARKKFLGAKVKIDGPLESASSGHKATYINWRMARRDPQGRYHVVSPIMGSRLTEGYEQEVATVIAIQPSEQTSKSPYPDAVGGYLDPGGSGPDLDFVVKFTNGSIALCTCPLKSVDGNFRVVEAGSVAPK
jgi:hypothetical protein